MSSAPEHHQSHIEIIITNVTPLIEADVGRKTEIIANISNTSEIIADIVATGPRGAKGETGATGPRGEKGDKGEKGEAGDNAPVKGVDYFTEEDIEEVVGIAQQRIVADKAYVHEQMVPSDTWTVYHGLDKWPAVTIVDSTDAVVIGDIDYVDSNVVRITFSAAFSGKAYFN